MICRIVDFFLIELRPFGGYSSLKLIISGHFQDADSGFLIFMLETNPGRPVGGTPEPDPGGTFFRILRITEKVVCCIRAPPGETTTRAFP